MSKITTTYLTLENGLGCVHVHEPGAMVGYCGVAVRAGSRDEDVNAGEAGLAHFVEHTIFKGTRRRTSWHIINRMEAVGGELNAFTTKEDTVVYSAFSRANLGRALELVADLIINSQFPKVQLDREREVVCDEIDSYLDQPSEAVFDDFEDLIFAGDSLGHNILGTKESVMNLTSEDCRNWLNKYYNVSHVILFYAGSSGVNKFRAEAEKYFSELPAGSPVAVRESLGFFPLFDEHRVIDSHQSHVVMGAGLQTCSMAERTVLALLTNIVGGPGMNSLLNVSLRERRGLVYNVEASTTMFSNGGEFTIYFGCDPGDVPLCRQIVERQIADLAEHPLSERCLSAAKKQYLGQLILADDNRDNRAIAIARATLFRGKALTAGEMTKLVRDVSAESLRQAAEKVSRLSVLTMGPR
ncbi:MAG: M16 family metallopeptidase [Muribaculaceae bacterium]